MLDRLLCKNLFMIFASCCCCRCCCCYINMCKIVHTFLLLGYNVLYREAPRIDFPFHKQHAHNFSFFNTAVVFFSPFYGCCCWCVVYVCIWMLPIFARKTFALKSYIRFNVPNTQKCCAVSLFLPILYILLQNMKNIWEPIHIYTLYMAYDIIPNDKPLGTWTYTSEANQITLAFIPYQIGCDALFTSNARAHTHAFTF